MGFRFFEKNRIICLGAGMFCLLMLLFPEITVSASKEAIGVWMNAVVPSLLPFMMIADYMKRNGIQQKAGGDSITFLMTFLSGYPMGAKLAGDRYREGELDEEGLYRILCYAMITGPAFLVGGVGVAFYQSKTVGYILTLSHYAGALCCGLCLVKRKKREAKCHCRNRQTAYITTSQTPFADCILSSFRTLVIVLAYIVLFMIGTDFLEATGLLQLLPDAGAAFCKGLLEMTVGCREIAATVCSVEWKLILTSFVISFGGLSVLGQSMSMLSGCPVTFLQILKIKVFHGIFSAIWTFTICSFVV